jgi:hypothetical protein
VDTEQSGKTPKQASHEERAPARIIQILSEGTKSRNGNGTTLIANASKPT